MAKETPRAAGAKSAASSNPASPPATSTSTNTSTSTAPSSPSTPSGSPRNGSRGHTTPIGTPQAVTNTVNAFPTDRDREARRRRVAEAAYYRAQRRGFAPGHEVDDWLEAEKEVDNTGEESQSK